MPMAPVRTPHTEPLIDETTEIEWREYLARFAEDVFPPMAERGMTFGEAFTVWSIVRCMNRLDTVIALLQAEADDLDVEIDG